jgi:hypothetical protein
MVVEKVKNPAICKKFGSLGKLRGEKNSMLPKKNWAFWRIPEKCLSGC